MSYGNVYIKDDIRKLKQARLPKTRIIEEIARRIRERYSNITKTKALRIATRGYNARGVEWSWD